MPILDTALQSVVAMAAHMMPVHFKSGLSAWDCNVVTFGLLPSIYPRTSNAGVDDMGDWPRSTTEEGARYGYCLLRSRPAPVQELPPPALQHEAYPATP